MLLVLVLGELFVSGLRLSASPFSAPRVSFFSFFFFLAAHPSTAKLTLGLRASFFFFQLQFAHTLFAFTIYSILQTPGLRASFRRCQFFHNDKRSRSMPSRPLHIRVDIVIMS